MAIELREIGPDDGAAFRAIRLRALADAPDAFGGTLADSERYPDVYWRERTTSDGPTVIVFDGDRPVAMGGLSHQQGEADSVVWGMWTAPEARGHGHAARILRHLLERHRPECGVSLHVAEHNHGARRLYVAQGFESTGDWSPLRAGSPVRMERLRWAGWPTEERDATASAVRGIT